ncbi:MAG: hypothetical protein A2X23_12820 [Chloroflexi bacterium GWC2_73_18]|nr:MAG: hypothetical protein A2X23_12820 [Chloroflexi bacterium GWC2_73_18]
MPETLVPVSDFSPAKARLSELMTAVFHGHQPQLVSRHHGKEQMLLVRPDDLVAMLADRVLRVEATYDAGEVTLAIPEMGLLGFGETFDEAADDLLEELRAYAVRFFEQPALFLASSRAGHAAAILRFALTPPELQRDLLLEFKTTADLPTSG